jgi:hypothetical protein
MINNRLEDRGYVPASDAKEFLSKLITIKKYIKRRNENNFLVEATGDKNI